MRKKSSFKKKKNYLFLVSIISLCILIYLVYTLSSLFFQIYSKYNEKAQLEKKLVKLENENDKLSKDLEKLKDPEYIAKYAREKYYYSKDGEILIKIP